MPVRKPVLCSAAAAATSLVLSVSAAPAAPLYGGPTYNADTQTGYDYPVVPYAPGSPTGSGTGVGSAQKYDAGVDLGSRGIRWNAGGFSELGNLGTDSAGYTFSVAYGVNAAGTATGYAGKYNGAANQGYRAVRWDAGSTVAVELGGLGADVDGTTSAIGYAINPAGSIAGYATKFTIDGNRGDRAVRWNAGSTAAIELGTLGASNSGMTESQAHDINASGAAAGYALKYEGNVSKGPRAVRWDAGSVEAVELGNLGTNGDGETISRAYALNGTGAVAGYAVKYTEGGVRQGSRAVRWDAGSVAAVELGNLGTSAGGDNESYAYDINDAGDVAGTVVKYVGGSMRGYRAVRWQAGTTDAIELGNLGTENGFTTTSAYAINAAGLIAGQAVAYDAFGDFLGFRAVVWGTDNNALDLNTLLSPADAAQWTLYDARGISDTNWVSGLGRYDPDGVGPLDSYDRTFVLQVVPEPAGLGLLGLASLALLRRRRR